MNIEEKDLPSTKALLDKIAKFEEYCPSFTKISLEELTEIRNQLKRLEHPGYYCLFCDCFMLDGHCGLCPLIRFKDKLNKILANA